MNTGEGYELVLTPPAVRAVQTTLSEAVAAAVIGFITGPLVANPRRVGKMLRRELQGIWSARRGTYRVLYRINDNTQEVLVLRNRSPSGGLPLISERGLPRARWRNHTPDTVRSR